MKRGHGKLPNRRVMHSREAEKDKECRQREEYA